MADTAYISNLKIEALIIFETYVNFLSKKIFIFIFTTVK